MRSIIALFIAAVVAEEAAAEAEAEVAAPEVVNMLETGVKLADGLDTTIMFAGSKEAGYMFTGKAMKKNSWFGVAWGGSGEGNMVGADYLTVSANNDGNIEVKDLWSAAAPVDKKNPTDQDGDQNWAKADASNADLWMVNYVAQENGADKDVAVPCGTAAEGETAAAMAAFQMEWFANLESNDISQPWGAEGDFFVETDDKCAVVWWSNGARPAEVEAGAKALAAAATVAIAALYM